MNQYGFSGLYGKSYGAAPAVGSKPTGRPWSCWRVGANGGWQLSPECVDRAREPYHENAPDSREPSPWQINFGFRALNPTDKGRLWAQFSPDARLRGIIGAVGTMSTADVAALNKLTKQYVPEYSTVFDLTKTLIDTNGPAGTLAPSLWLAFVQGTTAMRAGVIRQIGEKVRVARGQNPTPPSQQKPVLELPTEEEEDPGIPATTYLIGGLTILGVVGGAFYLLRSR